MKNKPLIILVVLLALGIGYLYFTRPAPPTEPPATVTETITIDLADYSDSGQSGTATLTSTDGKTLVEISVTGYETTGPQPAHIHTGGCPRIGPVIHKLTDVVDGNSSTTLDLPLSEILASSEELNINVHASYDDFSTYTSCGNLGNQ